MASERVQKILARAGIASRRKAEQLITEGAVTINGKVAHLGQKAELGRDAIKVNGKLMQANAKEPATYIAFYKPRGVISMFADPEGRPTIGDFLPKIKIRLFPIGRLDYNSEGLILLTNDGDFAEKVSKRDDIPRVYHVKVRGHLDAEMITRLERGAKTNGRMFKPHRVRVAEDLASKAKIEIVLMGGPMSVDLKAYFEIKGFLVERITRTAIGHMTIHGLAPGHYRPLRESQVVALLEQPELAMRKLEEFKTSTRESALRPKDRESEEGTRGPRGRRDDGPRGPRGKKAPVGAGARIRPRRDRDSAPVPREKRPTSRFKRT